MHSPTQICSSTWVKIAYGESSSYYQLTTWTESTSLFYKLLIVYRFLSCQQNLGKAECCMYSLADVSCILSNVVFTSYLYKSLTYCHLYKKGWESESLKHFPVHRVQNCGRWSKFPKQNYHFMCLLTIKMSHGKEGTLILILCVNYEIHLGLLLCCSSLV